MCREQVTTSHLLDNCPYINRLITVPNPHQAKDFTLQTIENEIALEERAKEGYDYVGKALHVCWKKGMHKIDINSAELGFEPDSKRLEVFITPEIDKEVYDFLCDYKPPFINPIDEGYILRHTDIKEHEWHTWDADEYITNNYPSIPILNTGFNGLWYLWQEDINYTFVLLRYATYRVLSSSVMVHACEAMDLNIDVINYGKPDRKVWPLDQDLVLSIREGGEWIK